MKMSWVNFFSTWVPYHCNILLGACIFGLIYYIEFIGLPSAPSGFYCRDPKLSVKFKDTVNWKELYAITFLLPLLVILIVKAIRKLSFKINYLEVWLQYKEALRGIAMTIFFTGIMKFFISEPRPQFFDICEPDANKFCKEGEYVRDYNCTSTRFSKRAVTDSLKSFPSGHSSMSTFVSLYSAYIIETRMPINKTGGVLKSVLISGTLCVALYVTSSRITDGRHHWWDALAGVIVGSLNFVYIIIHVILSNTTSTNINNNNW